ncbi:hypothetical protein DFH28DRAFT_911603 [Melampsora americana]|nr:hypothetical protein DFH28DRAFT_911603 [Melampsora americana]
MKLFFCDFFGLAKLLKRFVRQPRPIESNKISSSYGMPSTHSSSISFFGICLFLTSISLPIHRNLIGFLKPILSNQSILILLDPQSDDSLHNLHLLQFIRIWFGLSFLTFSGIVCWSRVRLGYHTPSQVIVGSLIHIKMSVTRT